MSLKKQTNPRDTFAHPQHPLECLALFEWSHICEVNTLICCNCFFLFGCHEKMLLITLDSLSLNSKQCLFGKADYSNLVFLLTQTARQKSGLVYSDQDSTHGPGLESHPVLDGKGVSVISGSIPTPNPGSFNN